jgi:hypothetical protein
MKTKSEIQQKKTRKNEKPNQKRKKKKKVPVNYNKENKASVYESICIMKNVNISTSI